MLLVASCGLCFRRRAVSPVKKVSGIREKRRKTREKTNEGKGNIREDAAERVRGGRINAGKRFVNYRCL